LIFLVEIDDPQNGPVGLWRFMSQDNYLSDLLGVKVDLVVKQILKPAICLHVLKEAEEL